MKNAPGRVAALFIIVLLAAIFFRVHRLGEPAFRADTILFYNITRSVDGAWTIMSQWLNLMGITAQLPFPMAFVEGFLNVFRLEPTHFTVRLPSALWGIATVLAAWSLGLRLGNRATAFSLFLLTAVNPYLILTSREACYYPPMVLGAFLLPLAAMDALRAWQNRENSIPMTRIAMHLAGLFLIIYSQPAGWFAALMLACLSVLFTLLQVRNAPAARTRAVALIALSVAVGLPVLMASWGVPQLRMSSSPEMRAYAQSIFEGGPSLWQMLNTSATSFFIGRGYWRTSLAVVLMIAGISGVSCFGRKEPWLWVIPAGLLVGLAFFLIGRQAIGGGFYSRYVLVYQPLYLALLVLGIRWLGQFVERRLLSGRADESIRVLSTAIALANVIPAWWCTQLTGKPTPYQDIRNWLDNNLPRGTLVVVDRWMEPWNEMALYKPRNVIVTFTVPDEPYATFVANRWRDSVVEFFRKFPDSAYVEISRNYWDRPDVGRWEWPERYFARHTTITNVAALKLREYGLANREDFFAATTNRILVNIHWNTLEDLVARARVEGRPAVLVYGPEWGYAKPWSFTRMFTDYRVMYSRATMRVFWLRKDSTPAKLRLKAAAFGRDKQVRVAGQSVITFPVNHILTVDVACLMSPGEHVIEFRSLGRPDNSSALFVESAEIIVP